MVSEPGYVSTELLTDADIRRALELGEIVVHHLDLQDPSQAAQIQPASLDLRLADIGWPDGTPIKTERRAYLRGGVKVVEDGWWLRPGVLYLGVSLEAFELSPQYKLQLHGKSSMGRLGVAIHVTAGLIDPGFQGDIVFEIVNMMQHNDDCGYDVWVAKGQAVCHVEIFKLKKPATTPYGAGRGSHYQGQRGLRPSRMWLTHTRKSAPLYRIED